MVVHATASVPVGCWLPAAEAVGGRSRLCGMQPQEQALKNFGPLPKMHRLAGEFLDFLDDYEPAERATVALEFVASFIEEGNAKEIIAALGDISPDVKAQFLASVQSAPTTDAEWARLRFVGANLDEADEARARDYWRRCVSLVRQALEESQT